MTACPKCANWPKWKDGLLDLALGASPSRELEAHLKTCPTCSQALAELRARRRQMDEALPKMMQGVEPSAGFHARLMASVGEHPSRTRSWLGLPAAIAAATVVVLAALFLISKGRWPMSSRGRDEAPAVLVDLERWQSPTAQLLRPPVNGFVQAGPKLGKFYFPLQSTPPPNRPREKRTGVNK